MKKQVEKKQNSNGLQRQTEREEMRKQNIAARSRTERDEDKQIARVYVTENVELEHREREPDRERGREKNLDGLQRAEAAIKT